MKLQGLFPYDRDGAADFSELPFEKPLKAEIFQPADPDIKRLYWAVVSRIARGMGRDKEDVHADLCAMADHCHVYFSERHGQVRVPKSVSDRKCDAAVFRRYFDTVIPLIYSELGIEPAALADLLEKKRKIERSTPLGRRRA